MRFISVCLVVFFLVLWANFAKVFAHGTYLFPEANPGQINESLQRIVPIRFLPSHPLFFTIQIKESFFRMFKPSAEKKASFDFIVAGKRIKESYLMFEANDAKAASKGLVRYGLQLEKFSSQFEKVKSQNQDVTALTNEAAEGLKDHEVLLSAIYQKWRGKDIGGDFDLSFDEAFSYFGRVVFLIDQVQPGVVDRYKSISGGSEPVPAFYPTPF